MKNIVVHPALAIEIARVVNERGVAASMIDTVFLTQPYKHDAYIYWREQHIAATRKLADMGIFLSTYTIDNEKEITS